MPGGGACERAAGTLLPMASAPLLPLVFGHGSETSGDELNSRESFVRVMQLPVDGVELDVRRSADDELFAMHDPALPDGRLIGMTPSDEVPGRLVTLADALDLCAGRLVNLEVKSYPTDPEFDPDERVTGLVLDLLAERGGRDRVILSSFGMGCVDLVRARAPWIDTAVLLFHPGDPEVLLDEVVAHGHRIVHPFARHLDADFMRAAVARGLTVNVWTVRDDPASLARLVDLGVHGIITGAPDVLLGLLGRGGDGRPGGQPA